MEKIFRKISVRYYIILCLLVVIYLCSRMCRSSHHPAATIIRNDMGKVYAGSAACADCHRDIYKTHMETAHFRDSRPAARETIRGNFDSGRNRFIYQPEVEVILEQSGIRYFQTAVVKGREVSHEPFDIVIGSGRKGQTYLYWKNEKIYQLPVSWHKASNSWCNSPGYPVDSPLFTRLVQSYCLECHTTYAQAMLGSPNEKGDSFDQSQIIYGVDCEKCHGPGAEHVAFHQSHPDEKTGHSIINARRLSRQQRLDACALCHSGARVPLRPAFSFTTGDKLDDFSLPKYSDDNVANLDVHGNQYGLLTSSKCFRLSQMDCSSCHNVHANEFNRPALYSQRCMNCHNADKHNTCTMKPAPGLVLSNNCIDCHMPALPSQKILLGLSNGSTIHNLVRTHRVAIYPENTREYLEKVKGQ